MERKANVFVIMWHFNFHELLSKPGHRVWYALICLVNTCTVSRVAAAFSLRKKVREVYIEE